MIKKALLSLLSIFLLASCGETVTYRNHNIDTQIRTELTALNKKLFNSFKAGDISIFKGMMSDTLNKLMADSASSFFNIASSYLKNYSSNTLEELYVKSNADIVSIPIINDRPPEYGYQINYHGISKNTYLTFTQTGDRHNVLLTTVFGKVDGEWKLHAVNLGQHSFNGQPAPYYYLKALEAYDSSYIIEAAKNIKVAKALAKPSGNYWHYIQEDEMKALFKKIVNDFSETYTFPVTLKEIPSRPRLINISHEYVTSSLQPVISYLTSIDIKNVRSLEKENKAVQQKVKELFKELYITNDYVIYMAYNKLPDGTEMVDRYGFVDSVQH